MRALQVDRLQRRRDLADGCKGLRLAPHNGILAIRLVIIMQMLIIDL